MLMQHLVSHYLTSSSELIALNVLRCAVTVSAMCNFVLRRYASLVRLLRHGLVFDWGLGAGGAGGFDVGHTCCRPQE